tara:strand:- start:867 stop:1556 length:690 start_codon:yes stop_codon:yes gene_type:complete
MTTAQQIIADALDEIQVSEAEASISDFEAQSAKRELNRMMLSLPVKTGFTEVESLSETLSVKTNAEDFIKKNLAVRLASSYNRPVPATLAQAAAQTRRDLMRDYVKLRPLSYPTTLPIGLGTSNNDYFLNDDQFPFGEKRTVTDVRANYTVLTTDDLVQVDCSSAPITVTLPAASSANGYGFDIEKTDTSKNMLIISPNGTDKIRGNSSVRFNQTGRRISIVSDGTEWV